MGMKETEIRLDAEQKEREYREQWKEHIDILFRMKAHLTKEEQKRLDAIVLMLDEILESAAQNVKREALGEKLSF